jgi:glutamate dehydrogenase/leucine dehydrogenase
MTNNKQQDVVLGYKTSIVAQMLDSNSKQETIEEAAERILSKEGVKLHPSGLETYLKGNVINAMVEMVKWQAKQMYSEEEVLELLHDRMIYTLGSDYQRTTTTEWFEQFKK